MENKQMDKRRSRTDDQTQKTNKGVSHAPGVKDQQKTNADNLKSKPNTSFNEPRPDVKMNSEWDSNHPVTGHTEKRDTSESYAAGDEVQNQKNQKFNPINPETEPSAMGKNMIPAESKDSGFYTDTKPQSSPDSQYNKNRNRNEAAEHTDVLDEQLDGTERENQIGKSIGTDHPDSHSPKKKNQAPPSNFS